MSEDRRKILEMLGAGKISAEEAEKLLDAIGKGQAAETGQEPSQERTSSGKAKPKFIRIMVEPKDGCDGDRVNIKIPIMIVRAGMKLSSMIPHETREALYSKGIKFKLNDLDPEKIDEICEGLMECAIDVDDEDEKVRIFCE